MKLVWLDLETTGLDPQKDSILEVAASESTLEAPFDARPIYHAVLAFPKAATIGGAIDPFVVSMHAKNGLWDECEAKWREASEPLYGESRTGVQRVERELLALVSDISDWEEKPTMAGNCVGFDHGFLKRWMPALAARFHYRHYDVSSVKLFCRSLGMPRMPGGDQHRAEADVRESIEHARACATWLAAGGWKHDLASRGGL